MKRIIDINEDYFEIIKHDVKNGQDYKPLVLIANSIPYEERPHGKWIKHDFKTFGGLGSWDYKCSECGKVYGGEYHYCPHCGAKMDKKEADNDK